MLKRLKTALTSRSTALLFLLLLAAAMLVAAIVPQGGLDAAAGAAGDAKVPAKPDAFVALLGLDHVFSTPWFAAIALLFVTSLAFSTFDQFRLARSRTFQPPPPGGGEGASSALPVVEIGAILKAEGYRRVSATPGRSRHVRHWQGYWGNFLLHAGMTVTALFAVIYVLTEHRARLHVVTGQPTVLTPGSYPVKRGLVARDLPLPVEVSLYKLVPTFGVNDQLIDISSDLIFTDARGASRELRVAVNDYQDYQGVTVYQLVKYGHAFFVELDDGDGAKGELLLEPPFPEKRGAASYVNRPLDGGKVLKAKYYSSADRTKLLSNDPQLVLRLQEGDQVIGELTLLEGQAGRLGPWNVRLTRVGWWTELLFEGSLGTTGIFGGFAVLLLGGVLVFFAVPREVIVTATSDGCTVMWRSTRFSDMFREEAERVVSRCTGGRAG